MSKSSKTLGSHESGSLDYVDPEKKAKKPWQAWLSGSPVLFISIIVHLVFLALALFFVVQSMHERKKPIFTGVAVSAPVQLHEQKVQMNQMARAQTAPEVTSRIVTPDLSDTNLPAISLPSDNPGEGNSKLGAAVMGGGGQAGAGAGGGVPMEIDAATIAANFYGIPDGQGLGLLGRFYDLKQTSGGEPSGMTIHRYPEVIADYINQGWPDNYFKKYFAGPKPLYAPEIFMPYMLASDGPKAFNLQGLVQPKLWLVHYEGKVQVPRTAEYRFVGYADDVLEVAVDRKLVLEGSYRGGPDPIPNVIKRPSTETYKYSFLSAIKPGLTRFAFQCGPWMALQEGQIYDIQILIGEHPGGECGFWLFVQEKNHTYALTPEGSPILPPFRLSHAALPSVKLGCPPYDRQTDLGWELVGYQDDSGDTNQ